MKHSYSWILVGIFLIHNLVAQTNLVPNPNFAAHTGCQLIVNQNGHGNSGPLDIPALVSWRMPGRVGSNSVGSADYYRVNTCGCQFSPCPSPRSEESMTGIIPRSNGLETPGWTEYLTVKMNQSLTQGKLYYAQFYTHNKRSDFSLNRMGVHFSQDLLEQSSASVPLAIGGDAHIENPPERMLLQSLGWTRIAGLFRPENANNEWITIGNFHDGVETEYFSTDGSTLKQPYYFLDDVSVYDVEELLCNPGCGPANGPISLGLVPNVMTPNGDGINDQWNVAVSNAVWYEVEIFDSGGALVHSDDHGLMSPSPTNPGQLVASAWAGQNSFNPTPGPNGLVPNGVYSYSFTAHNCNGSTSTISGNIFVFGSAGTSGTAELLDLVELDFYLCCTDDLVISNETFGNEHTFKANNSIQSFNVVHTVGANVTYQAGNEITILPSFQVSAGATFTAQLEACSPPGFFRRAQPEPQSSPSLSQDSGPRSSEYLYSLMLPRDPAIPEPLIENEWGIRANNLQEANFAPFPNPNTGVFTFSLRDVSNDQISYVITDLNGHVLIEQNAVPRSANREKIDISEFPKGIYFLRINYDREIIIQKIIHQ